MRKSFVLLSILSILLIAAIVYAQGPGMMGGKGMMGKNCILTKLMHLGLDAEQKEAVKEIVRTKKKETIKKRADLAIARTLSI